MPRAKNAHVFYNAGITHIVEYPSQKTVCKSIDFNRALRRGRKLGYNVRVYSGWGSKVYPAIKQIDS